MIDAFTDAETAYNDKETELQDAADLRDQTAQAKELEERNRVWADLDALKTSEEQ